MWPASWPTRSGRRSTLPRLRRAKSLTRSVPIPTFTPEKFKKFPFFTSLTMLLKGFLLPACSLLGAAYTGCNRGLTVALITIASSTNGAIYSGFQVGINRLKLRTQFRSTFVKYSWNYTASYWLDLVLSWCVQGTKLCLIQAHLKRRINFEFIAGQSHRFGPEFCWDHNGCVNSLQLAKSVSNQ